MVAKLLGTNATTAVTAAALAAGLIALLWRARWRLRGSTLTAPCVWALVATAAVALVEIAAGPTGGGVNWIVPLRYAAAMSTFCPAMAVLGAKRPQNGAWQWIVLSLWVVLCLPPAEWWLFRSGQPNEVYPPHAWFLLILIGVAAVIYLPTRYGIPSLLFSLGQTVLLWPQLPFGGRGLPEAAAPLASLSLFLASALLATRLAGRPRDAAPLDRAWLEFRDAFGTLWSLRVAERFNAAARMYDWPVQLGWRGFSPSNPQPGASEATLTRELEATLALNLRNLLRRFMSHEWLAARLAAAADESAEDGGENAAKNSLSPRARQ